MNKTLGKKFVRTTMTAVSILLIIIIGAINTINLINTNKRSWESLEMISRMSELSKQAPEGRPEKPDRKPSEVPPMERERGEYDIYMASNFFFVDYTDDGEVSRVDVSRTSVVTEDEAVEMADEAISSGESKGESNGCYYITRNVQETGETSVVFLDVSNNKKMAFSVLVVSLLVGLACWLLMLLISIPLSRRAVKPIAENIEKQKQFITDAGHELKTPLAIIQANAEAMELYNGDNKWLANIKFQVDRLTKLTNDLLSLAKMDESTAGENRDNVNLSEELASIIEGFAPSCESKGMKIDSDIAENVVVKYKRTDFEKLIGILIDNAIKYGKEETPIDVKLSGSGRNWIMSVENECEVLPEVDPDKLFERFYRSDKARNQESGGCGIGLSIAKSIVESHGGRIRAEYVGESSIRFVVEI